MPVKQTGGVRVAGDPTPIAQPSPSPGVRADLAGFNVPFDRDLFTQLIKSHGYDVVWEKATLCPFLKGTDPKAHDLNCTMCHNGFMYYGALPTRMHFQSLNIQQQYFAYGHFDSGRAQISAYPEFKMSFWDRITLSTSRGRHTDRVIRLRGTNRDRPKFNPIAIDDLRWAVNSTQFKTATQNVDFTVDPVTGEIVWLTNNRPDADQWYSTVYYFHPQYIVLDVPHHIRDQPELTLDGTTDKQYEFPVQVVAQIDQFIRDEGRDPSNENSVVNPFPAQGKTRWQGS